MRGARRILSAVALAASQRARVVLLPRNIHHMPFLTPAEALALHTAIHTTDVTSVTIRGSAIPVSTANNGCRRVVLPRGMAPTQRSRNSWMATPAWQSSLS